MSDAEREMQYTPLDQLELSGLRDVRQNVVDQIKERIEQDGYDPARPMRVLENGDGYVVADGNHRLQALRELQDENAEFVPDKVPTVVEKDADIVAVSVEANENESTFAEQDLFDYLDYIDRLRDSHTQAEIAERLRWSRELVKDYVAILNKVGEEVLQYARNHQEGRSPLNGEDSPEYEFTQGWFRNSAIYELNESWQLELLKWFIAGKNATASNSAVKNKVDEYKQIQDQLAQLNSDLQESVDDEVKEQLRESVMDGEHTKSSLADAIENANAEAENQAYFGVDAVEKLQELPDNDVDVVVMDPPYGTDYTSHRDTENPEFGENVTDTVELLHDVFTELKRVAKENAHLYLFFGMNKYEEISSVAQHHFDVEPVPLIWAKNNHAPTRDAQHGFDRMYAHQYEPIFVLRQPNGDQRELKGGVCSNVLEHPVPKGDERWHDAQKPLSLIEELIGNSTGAGERVLDPFAGSGVSLLAAEKLGRNYIGIEKNEAYESRFKKELRRLKE